MKTTLTVAQSAQLIEMGIDPRIASCGLYAETVETLGAQLRPTFTLYDLLLMLPKVIVRGGQRCQLCMMFDEDNIEWNAFYSGVGSVLIGTELIDSLFQLLIWVIEHKDVKPNKDN